MSEYFNLLVNNCQVAGYLISWSLELELESGGESFYKVFNAYPPSAERESAKRMP